MWWDCGERFLPRLVQKHLRLDLENKKVAALLESLIFGHTHDCVLACGMAAFSKQQLRHISPAGVYHIKEFLSLPPVSSKSGWEKSGRCWKLDNPTKILSNKTLRRAPEDLSLRKINVKCQAHINSHAWAVADFSSRMEQRASTFSKPHVSQDGIERNTAYICSFPDVGDTVCSQLP